MADLTNGSSGGWEHQNNSNYFVQIPKVTNIDTYIEGAIAFGNGGWGSNAPFYSDGARLWVFDLA